MKNVRVAMPAYRIVRAPVAAADLHVGDYVHDPLVPFVVARFVDSPEHVVAVVGRLASNTDMGVRFLASATVDVSRMVHAEQVAPAPRVRHLSIVPPVGGTL